MNLQLKRLRKQKGYKTQSEFAQAIGIPERRYASWEREEVMMNLEQACIVADALSCTLDELVGRSWSKPQFFDPRQEAINEAYEAMTDEGKDDLATYADRMVRIPELVEGSKSPAASEKMGA